MAKKWSIQGPFGIIHNESLAALYLSVRDGIEASDVKQIGSELERILAATRLNPQDEKTADTIQDMLEDAKSQEESPREKSVTAPPAVAQHIVPQPKATTRVGHQYVVRSFDSPKNPGDNFSVKTAYGRDFYPGGRPLSIGDLVVVVKETKPHVFYDIQVVTPAVKESPAYLKRLPAHTSSLSDFCDMIEESLAAISSGDLSENNRATELAFARRRYEDTHRKNLDSLDMYTQLDHRYDSDQPQAAYLSALNRTKQMIGRLHEAFDDMDKKIQEKNKPQAPEITQDVSNSQVVHQAAYGIRLKLGTRQVNMTFSEQDLPASEGVLIDYLKDESNFSARRDREIVKAFLDSMPNGTILYNGQRRSGNLKDNFRQLAKTETTRQGQHVIQKAYGCEITLTQGGSLAYQIR